MLGAGKFSLRRANFVYITRIYPHVHFEWDDAKNAVSIAKHGIDFRRAIQVFDGPRVRIHSDREGEPRRKVIGVIDGLVIAVAYTLRGRARRIISARPASRRERRRFDITFPDAR